MAQPLPIAKHGKLELFLLPALANRHGLITGATGGIGGQGMPTWAPAAMGSAIALSASR